MTDASDRTDRVAAMAELATPFAIRVMATYRLADLVGDAATVDDLASAAGLHAPTLTAVVDHLVALGLLRCDGERLELTELGATLRSGAPGGLQHRFDLTQALGRADLAFANLHEAVRTGRPAFDLRFGMGYWASLTDDEQLVDSFHRSMRHHDQIVVDALRTSYAVPSGVTMVDVGGGSGGILARLLEQHDDVTGILVDLPTTAPVAEATLSGAAASSRITFVGADIRSSVPAGHAVYLLSMVLHDWPDSDASEILASCRAAARAGAELLIVEFDPASLPPTVASTINLHLMVCAGARQRTVEEHRALALDSGWSSCEVLALSDGLMILRAV